LAKNRQKTRLFSVFAYPHLGGRFFANFDKKMTFFKKFYNEAHKNKKINLYNEEENIYVTLWTTVLTHFGHCF
jgi:hypothetical protein